MAMTEAHRRYREKNPVHKKNDDEKRLDQIISAAAMAALAAKCKAAGVTRRQMLEALALSSFNYHTGVMVPTTITPGLSDEPATATVTPELPDEMKTDTAITPGLSDPPSADSEIEARVFKIIEEGVASPIPKRIVHEIYGGDYSEAAKQIRKLAKQQTEPEMIEKIKLLANRIDGDRPKTKTKEKE